MCTDWLTWASAAHLSTTIQPVWWEAVGSQLCLLSHNSTESVPLAVRLRWWLPSCNDQMLFRGTAPEKHHAYVVQLLVVQVFGSLTYCAFKKSIHAGVKRGQKPSYQSAGKVYKKEVTPVSKQLCGACIVVFGASSPSRPGTYLKYRDADKTPIPF